MFFNFLFQISKEDSVERSIEQAKLERSKAVRSSEHINLCGDGEEDITGKQEYHNSLVIGNENTPEKSQQDNSSEETVAANNLVDSKPDPHANESVLIISNPHANELNLIEQEKSELIDSNRDPLAHDSVELNLIEQDASALRDSNRDPLANESVELNLIEQDTGALIDSNSDPLANESVELNLIENEAAALDTNMNPREDSPNHVQDNENLPFDFIDKDQHDKSSEIEDSSEKSELHSEIVANLDIFEPAYVPEPQIDNTEKM